MRNYTFKSLIAIGVTAFSVLLVSCSYYIDKAPESSRNNFLTPEEKAEISFDVVSSRVFQPRCVRCHADLNTYEAVKARLTEIKRTTLVVKSMPKDSSLSEGEAAILSAWIENGAPRDRAGETLPSPTPNPSPGPLPGDSEVSYDFVNQKVFIPRCVSCHSSGSAIDLTTFEAVKSRMKDIIRTTLIVRTMPEDSQLTDRESTILLNWIAAGAPLTPGNQNPDPTPEPKPTPVELEPTFKSIKENILDKRCVLCHSPSGKAKHIPLLTREDLVDSPREIVIPNNPDESGIVLAIEREDEKRMPPAPQQSLSAEEFKVIRKWIEDGAQN